MASKRILITGGAGFIGSHLVDELVHLNHDVTVLDNLEPQVHHNSDQIPSYLNKKIKFIRGDVRNKEDLSSLLKDIDVVYHLAASVGVAQSMYQPHKFYDNNVLGTANLMDLLINSENSVSKVVVASSMSIYGEGAYSCPDHGYVESPIRLTKPSTIDDWSIKCPHCGKTVHPIPTPESKSPDCSTIYALTKKDQEDMVMLMGKNYGLDTTALRFFGTYGERQALSNPYTGVCAIFSTALLAGNSPLIYEDGLQTRDLIYVKDLVQGLVLAMENPRARNEIFNVGTGQYVSILEVANTLAQKLNIPIEPQITGKFRAGDVRHITADISKIQQLLGYHPQYTFDQGMDSLLAWITKESKHSKIEDRSQTAYAELEKKGLL